MIELTEPEKQKQIDRIRVLSVAWDELCSMHDFGYEFKNVCCLSNPILVELTYRYVLDVRRIKEYHKNEINPIDEYKISGYLSYWICKLRPVQYAASLNRFTGTQGLLNEQLSLHLSIGRINEERVKKKLPKINFQKDAARSTSSINNIVYTMKYRLTTGDNLAQIYKLTENF